MNQDSTDQTAILACMVDFRKAFNRLDHNLLVTKLSDTGVPGWLLKVVMAFLSNRKMVLRYKGELSSLKDLPGGGPQGTLLGLLLFLVYINGTGFENQINNTGELLTSKRNMKIANTIHLKYVDDLTLAETINLSEKLVVNPTSSRPQPDMYHARTGHSLPIVNSQVYQQLKKTENFAKMNQMQINYKKSKLMIFNPCRSLDFQPEFGFGQDHMEVVEHMKLLGVILQSDLKWSMNTANIVSRASNKLWIIRRLKELGAKPYELVDMFTKQCRSILEYGVPAWQGAITIQEKQDIERVQKMALRIIFGEQYYTYSNALELAGLDTLEDRRNKICLKFAKKAEQHNKHRNWFKPKLRVNTRQNIEKYWKPLARTERLRNSPICFLTNLLNKHYQK